MKGWEKRHPSVLFFWFLAVVLFPVLAFHPWILLLSLSGSLGFFSLAGAEKKGRTHGGMLLLVALCTVLNPVLNQRGETVLFFVNDRAVTGEALLFGLLSGLALVSALYWFFAFSRLMTVDQWFCVLRLGGDKLALMFTMVMRFVPLLSRRLALIRRAQRGIGLYTEENLFDRLKSEARVFNALATWALENGIVTADSMEARGYGCGRRSSFTRYRFTGSDCFATLLVVLFMLSALILVARGGFAFSCIPAIVLPAWGAGEIAIGVLYFFLAFLPVILCVTEEMKWRFLRRKA